MIEISTPIPDAWGGGAVLFFICAKFHGTQGTYLIWVAFRSRFRFQPFPVCFYLDSEYLLCAVC